MHFFHSFIVFLTLLASVRLDDIDPTPPPVKAKATVSLGDSRLFSGEDVQMTCSVPDDPLSNWKYKWFYDGVFLSSAEVYSLNKAQVLQSGNYTCQGEKEIESWPYCVSSTPSDPLNIQVDGGWVLLRTPLEPLIIEETTTLTCRTRDVDILLDVIFYKGEDLEIKKHTGKDLVLSNLTLEDNGMYSCRATWFKHQKYQSAQSLRSSVTVLDKLETPRLELLTSKLVRSGTQVTFRCTTKVNAREQGLSPEYYFIKDGNRLGRVSAKDTYSILHVSKEDAGFYSCKVRVRALNVERWSNEFQLKVRPPVIL